MSRIDFDDMAGTVLLVVLAAVVLVAVGVNALGQDAREEKGVELVLPDVTETQAVTVTRPGKPDLVVKNKYGQYLSEHILILELLDRVEDLEGRVAELKKEAGE